MKEKVFTWIPFYQELAKALLEYKDDRRPLVEWIYKELSKVGNKDGSKSLVSYLKMQDGTKIKDIDPFSVFAIFNRYLKIENKVAFLQLFKDKFSLISEVPVDFDGIPTVDSRRAFFYKWDEQNEESINLLWTLFEDVVTERDISNSFGQVINVIVPKYSLTMILYWISPYRFINLDDRNRAYLNTLGFPDQFPNLDYIEYSGIIKDIQTQMSNHIIPYSSFPEFSYNAWKKGQTKRIWMYNHYEDTFAHDFIRMGSSANGKLDFSSFKSKAEFSKAYQEVVGNKDAAIPDMYWKMMKEVAIGDIIVVFDSNGQGKTFYHQLYGWGRVISDVIYDSDDDNPIHRKVEWHLPLPQDPIKETRTSNTRYFHEVKGIEAANILNLLGINEEGEKMMEKINIDSYIQLLKANKNLILTGAPGTGKTYMAKEMAKQILGLDSTEALKTDKRFGFVQFHPSYDYTDFVEGLRPIREAQNGVIGFKRQDGVFKEFCKQAILSESADADTLEEINSNPTVWKVSLEGTGDNPTRTDCMNNGYIRIGWDRYGDVEDFLDYNDFYDGGKNVLRAFQSGMQIGDLVVSCYSAKEIDAVGVITGDYEYRAEGGEYPRYRTVKWLVKNIKENIVELNNNKAFVQSTVYKANIPADAALKIARKNSSSHTELAREDAAVFVIDEINRGEISKIFGELFFSIDPGYRGEKGIVKTQYQNMVDENDPFKEGFYVPENVYIIGTMNDIDRSVESMDFAMRRRFAWKEVSAESSMTMLDNNEKLKNVSAEKIIEIKKRMENLNTAILEVRELGQAYQIGASYFLNYANYKEYDDAFDKLWEYHLKGLLAEYLRGNIDVDGELHKLKDAYELKNGANNNKG